jgi:hypothetical protein
VGGEKDGLKKKKKKNVTEKGRDKAEGENCNGKREM